MLSTTSKSWSSTSLSGFWLKLPTVWVMPSWMAPLRAEDVVWGSQAEKKCLIIHSKTVSPDPRSIMGQHWKTPTFLYVVSPVGSIPRCPIVFFIFWDILVLGPWQGKPKKPKWKLKLRVRKKKNSICSRSKEEEINQASAGHFKTPCGNDRRQKDDVFSEEIISPTSAATFFRASGESGMGGGKLARSLR